MGRTRLGASENFDTLGFIDFNAGINENVPDDSIDGKFEWGRNAADMAYILYQVPVMVGVSRSGHADLIRHHDEEIKKARQTLRAVDEDLYANQNRLRAKESELATLSVSAKKELRKRPCLNARLRS